MTEEWRNSFEAFYSDMGDRPGPEYSIDRKDNSRGYSPDNCEWATATQQANNRRSNTLVEYEGETRSVSEWGRVHGIPSTILRRRLLSGRTMDEALNFKNRRFKDNR